MNIKTHEAHGKKAAEVLAEGIVVSTAEDGLDLLADLYYQGYDCVMLHEKNINPTFFDLKTGIAGDLLQKFSNFRMRLVIIGSFEAYASKSLQDFIRESNRGSLVAFVGSVEEGLEQRR